MQTTPGRGWFFLWFRSTDLISPRKNDSLSYQPAMRGRFFR
jgi:hypothetical protein